MVCAATMRVGQGGGEVESTGAQGTGTLFTIAMWSTFSPVYLPRTPAAVMRTHTPHGGQPTAFGAAPRRWATARTHSVPSYCASTSSGKRSSIACRRSLWR